MPNHIQITDLSSAFNDYGQLQFLDLNYLTNGKVWDFRNNAFSNAEIKLRNSINTLEIIRTNEGARGLLLVRTTGSNQKLNIEKLDLTSTSYKELPIPKQANKTCLLEIINVRGVLYLNTYIPSPFGMGDSLVPAPPAGVGNTQVLLSDGTWGMPSVIVDILQRLNNKVDKVPGKQLSDQNFTTALREKLENLPTSLTIPDFSIGDVSNIPYGNPSSVYFSELGNVKYFNFVLTEGPPGEMGEKGNTGDPGMTPNLEIGSVFTVPNSIPSAAYFTGSVENPKLNLILQAGPIGPPGAGLTPNITIGTVNTLPFGSIAGVTISGTAEDPILNFDLVSGPQGNQGNQGIPGPMPNFSIGSIMSAPYGNSPNVTISGTPTDPILNFTLVSGQDGPQGSGTFAIGTVTGVAWGNSPNVSNSGTPENAILDFTLVSGPPGLDASVTVGTVTEVPYGNPLLIDNSGTPQNVVLDFTIPSGPTGAAATIAVGSVNTVPFGNSPSVLNSGTPQNAILDFTLVTGPSGTGGMNWIFPAPSSSSDPGNPGDVSYDDNFFYLYNNTEWRSIPACVF